KCEGVRCRGDGSREGEDAPEADDYGEVDLVNLPAANHRLRHRNVDEGITRTDLQDQFKCCNVYAKEKCKKCFAKFYCSGGCAANSYNFHGNINDAYDVGCELERKRVECAIMLKAMQMMDEEEETSEE
ncbi:MAG: SPASM domain-containing protein, partial [Lachnospiraceae bacterium]|nr:SPASM domain-containing protein [Lachnospiraceae bacterium]